MVDAGALMKLLLGLTGDGPAIAAIVAVGILMIVYVTFGGMIGTTWVQIVKAVLLITGTLLLSLFVLAKFGFSLNALFGAAAKASGKGDAFLAPGLRYQNNGVELVSLGLALVLGTAGLPHILVRFYTVPTARAARASGVAFATILAVVAGLTIAASSSFAHDFYANVIRRGQRDESSEVRVARITALVIGAIAVVGILVGLFSCLILVAIGPTVIGPKGLWLKSADPIFPWENPGIVSIPLGFAAAWLGTLVSRDRSSAERYEELRTRAFTGLGAEAVEAVEARTVRT